MSSNARELAGYASSLPNFRNRIINGHLKSSTVLNQRGASSITGATGYTYDRWYYDGSTYLYQGIEDANVQNGTYVISWEGSGISAQYLLSTDTTGGTITSQTFSSTLNSGDTFTVSGTEFSNHLWIRFSGTLSNLDKVQVELGTVATPFEHRPLSVELSLAQRYFEKSYNLDVAPGTSTQDGSFRTLAPRTLSSATDYMYSVQYKVTKRAGTDLIIYSTDGTQGSVRDISGGTNTTLRVSLGAASNLITSFDIQDTRFYAFQWTANAEL